MDLSIAVEPRHLISNATISDHVSTYKNFWLSYMHPVVLFVGIITSFTILMVMPKLNASLNKKSKSYYTCLAGFDLMALITFHLLQVFLGDSLYLLTKGKFYFYFDKLGTFACKFSWCVWYFFLANSSYCYLEFSIERMIATTISLKSKGILTKKFRLFLWISVVTLPSASIALFAFYSNELIQNPSAIHGKSCDAPLNRPVGKLYCLAACVVMYFVPVICSLMCYAVILRKLRDYSSQRKNVYGIAKSRLSTKELKCTITILLVSLIQLLIFLPAGIFCASFCLARYLPAEMRINYPSTKMIHELHSLLQLFRSMSVISHSMNFFIYLIRVPSFHKYLLSGRDRAQKNFQDGRRHVSTIPRSSGGRKPLNRRSGAESLPGSLLKC